jgi:hypothetical protein
MVDMALSDAERARRYRDRRRGAPPPELKPHGTAAAHKRHIRARETPCDACRVAEAQRQADLYRARQERTT